METVTNNSHAVVEAVESLRREVALLGGRMTEIEQRIHGSPVRTSPIETSPPKAEEFSEELLIAIGATVAAYLGVAPHIRQIRLLGSVTWLQQGRITIQASREFAVHHG